MLSSSGVRHICQKSADSVRIAKALRCVKTSCLAVSVYPCESSDRDSRGKWALRTLMFDRVEELSVFHC